MRTDGQTWRSYESLFSILRSAYQVFIYTYEWRRRLKINGRVSNCEIS